MFYKWKEWKMEHTISYKSDGIKVSIRDDKSVISPVLALNTAIDTWKKLDSARTDKEIDVIDFSKATTSAPVAELSNVSEIIDLKKSYERPIIRKRLPNNEVNLDELDFKRAVTESALIRCPNCGQAHAAIIKVGNDWFLMRKNLEKDTFDVVAKYDDNVSENLDKYCCKENADSKDKLAFFKDVQKMKIDNKYKDTDMVVDNDTDVLCPVCRYNGNFSEWKDAFQNPLKFFETENPCFVCGGEVTMLAEKNGSSTSKCESCGYKI